MNMMATEELGDKFCVVTGGTGGVGLVTARRLAEFGTHVVIVGRDTNRGEAAQTLIRLASGKNNVEFLQADLANQDEVRRLAEAIASRCDRIDILINNAGGMFGQRTLSPQGLEMAFALNHLSYFLLTALLYPKLLAATEHARIINVSSAAHRRAKLDFDDLQSEKSYTGWLAYCRSKLANLLFTKELANRLDPERVTVNALHPGFVATDIGARHGLLPAFAWRLATLFALTPEQGAATSVYLAASPEAADANGLYFIQCKPAKPSPAALDSGAAKQLWAESVRLTGTDCVPDSASRTSAWVQTDGQ
jgi:NAD(P)-dependent dehydrogenase (short-subunit alcohol dehydrogenase family)